MKLLKVFLLDKRSLLMKSFPFLMMGITKLCTHLQTAPPSSFQPPPSSLQHPQQYLNQNIARNWAISPNLGRKIKSYRFWLKIGTHGILKVLIPNPVLDFWNSDPKTHFWANFGWKSQSCSYFLKIGTHGILMVLILIPTLVFSIANPKSIFGQICVQKFKVVCFVWKVVHMVSQGCRFRIRS